MPVELKVPAVGESITEVEIGEWLKHEGEMIAHDENLVALESEKATVELPAPVSGALSKIFKQRGEKAAVGEVIGLIEPVAKGTERKEEQPKPDRKESRREETHAEVKSAAKARSLPPAQRAIPEEELSEEQIEPAGLGGRMPKEEELRHVARVEERKKEAEKIPVEKKPSEPGREEEVVPMTPLRRTVAQRLVEAQQSMAILTTFNEIDMSAVMTLRKEHQESFTKKFGVKLGFMSFFVKACVEALKNIPQLNAFVRGSDIIYHNYFDIGVAIASEKGLVVPVLKNAERLSFAEIEKAIADFSARAQQNKLKPDELQGGTFTITNGGVFRSLLSTPIINPPQSGILGMHTIQERPVAHEGSVVIRPMMYVALSYDHRIVDGREAVLFLKRVKDVIENPARMLLEI